MHPRNIWLWQNSSVHTSAIHVNACTCMWNVTLTTLLAYLVDVFFKVLPRSVIGFQMITGSGRFFQKEFSLRLFMAKVHKKNFFNDLTKVSLGPPWIYNIYLDVTIHAHSAIIPIFPTFMVSHWFSYSYRSVNFDNTAMLSSRKIHRCCWDRYEHGRSSVRSYVFSKRSAKLCLDGG